MPNKTTIDYIFKGIPRDLWTKAQAKAAAQRPPISMKWVLLQLLEGWIAGKAPTNRLSDPPAKPKATKTPRKASALVTSPLRRATRSIEPDLGDSF